MSRASADARPVILLTGADGQVGWELRRTLSTLGTVVAFTRRNLDLRKADDLRNTVRRLGPDLIVNAAAYTAVDQAENEPELAMSVNGIAPGILAEEARRLGAAVVHYSTDYVFDGRSSRPYREDDSTNPLNVYGSTKLAGESALLQADVPAIVLRTSWIYGRRGRNFLLTIQRLARERDRLSIVDDQVGSPTWCRVLAEATAQILAPGAGRFDEYLREHGGVYHLSCAGATSWCGFARRILGLSSKGGRARAAVKPVATSAYPTPAERPAYSVLDNRRVHEHFGIGLPDWELALKLALAD